MLYSHSVSYQICEGYQHRQRGLDDFDFGLEGRVNRNILELDGDIFISTEIDSLIHQYIGSSRVNCDYYLDKQRQNYHHRAFSAGDVYLSRGVLRKRIIVNHKILFMRAGCDEESSGKYGVRKADLVRSIRTCMYILYRVLYIQYIPAASEENFLLANMCQCFLFRQTLSFSARAIKI